MTTTFQELLPATRARWERINRRVDRQLLRLQGRLDHPNTDRFTPWLVALLLFGMLFFLAWSRWRSLDMGTELALTVQGTWMLGDGFRPELTLAGGNLLAEQGALILYPLSIILRFLPRIATLLALQSAALAVGVVPIWRLARGQGRLRVGVTAALVFAYCFYAAVHNLNVAGFHASVFALPLLLAATRFGLDDRRTPYVVSVVGVMLCRADLGLAIAGLGVLLLIEGKRRWGLWTLLGGLTWFFVGVFLVQAGLNDWVYPHLNAFEDFGNGPLDVIVGIVSNPVDFLRQVFSEANFRAVIGLLAPVLFLPLVAPRYLLPALPIYALYLAADVPVGRVAESAQAVPIAAFVFIATVFALKRSGQVLVERVNVDRRVVLALVLTASVFFVADAASSPYARPWNWYERTPSDMALLEAVDRIPPDANVGASRRALPLLAERLAVYELNANRPVDAVRADIDAVVFNVDWVLLDLSATPWDISVDPTFFRSSLARNGYEQVYDGEEFNDGEPTDIRLFQFTGVVEPLEVG